MAFEALEWVLGNPSPIPTPAGMRGVQLVTEHLALDPKVGKLIASFGYEYAPPPDERAFPAAMALFKAVAEKNPDRVSRGQALTALTCAARTEFSRAEFQKSPQAEFLAANAENAFEAVIRDYADCPRLLATRDHWTLGKEANRELFELRNLRVGKVAPEIEGKDVDGRRFKLSDYRGKVVVIDFWGDW